MSRLNDFSTRLYGQVAPGMTGNLAVSPLGSFVLLDLLYEGSAGAAHEEIARVLGFSSQSLAEVGSLVKSLHSERLSLAQKIYLDQQAKLVPAYLQRVGPLLDEPVEVVEFGRPEEAQALINAWVSERTKGLIQDFLPKLPPLTVSVLVSVLHYQGHWAHPFPKQATAPADFAAPSGPMKVPMMRLQSQELAPFPVTHGQGVVLPHTDKTEMLLLLPDKDSSPDEVLAGLDFAVGRDRRPDGRSVVVELPRFQFEVPTFELTKAWAGLGLSATVSDADMSPMLILEPPAPIEMKVYHKTFVKVNEEGTEAAAATAVVMVPKGGRSEPEPPLLLRFDRPFAFVLRDSQSGAVLMLGRVEEPERQ